MLNSSHWRILRRRLRSASFLARAEAMGQALGPGAAGERMAAPKLGERWSLAWSGHMGMDQYLLIPFLGGWTSIYQLFWCSPGVQGFDTLPYGGFLKWGYPCFKKIYFRLGFSIINQPAIGDLRFMETPICLINVNNPWQNMNHPSLLWSSGYVYAVWSSHQKKKTILKDGFPEQIIDDHPSRLQGHGKYHPS